MRSKRSTESLNHWKDFYKGNKPTWDENGFVQVNDAYDTMILLETKLLQRTVIGNQGLACTFGWAILALRAARLCVAARRQQIRFELEANKYPIPPELYTSTDTPMFRALLTKIKDDTGAHAMLIMAIRKEPRIETLLKSLVIGGLLPEYRWSHMTEDERNDLLKPYGLP